MINDLSDSFPNINHTTEMSVTCCIINPIGAFDAHCLSALLITYCMTRLLEDEDESIHQYL